MRLTTKIAAALAATAALAVPAAGDPGQVWLYNWSGYIDPETVESFQETTGTEIVLDTYGDADQL